MKLALIVWKDAVSNDKWETYAEAKLLKPAEVRTVGYVVTEDVESILLAMNWDKSEEHVSQTMVIPKAWILERRELLSTVD